MLDRASFRECIEYGLTNSTDLDSKETLGMLVYHDVETTEFLYTSTADYETIFESLLLYAKSDTANPIRMLSRFRKLHRGMLLSQIVPSDTIESIVAQAFEYLGYEKGTVKWKKFVSKSQALEANY
jgi:hypothetical protein